MVGDDLIDHALPLIRATDVEMEVAGPLAETGGGLPAEVVEHIGEDDRRALLDEPSRLGGSLAAGGSGDECDLVLEASHGSRP